MTKVQQRTIALLAAFALVISCAMAFAPQHQADAKEYTLKAGTTFARATNLPYNKLISLSATNKAIFNATNDCNFYKFTTSGRNSQYRLTLQSFNKTAVNITVYDSGHHRFFATSYTAKSKNYKTVLQFPNLKRNSTYYVEVWRYAVDAPGSYYLNGKPIKNSVNTANAEYKLTVTEFVAKPKPRPGEKAPMFSAKSGSKKTITVTYDYRKMFDAEAYDIYYRRAWEKKSTKNQYHKYTTAKKCTFSVRYSKIYKVSVRPYRTVNGKKYYGAWALNNENIKATRAVKAK